MEERLLKFMDSEQLSSSKFADVIGVQRSSVSHILSGRNKPSFDFLQKTLRAFPYLNADWLILGEGSMYDDEDRKEGGNLFDQEQSAPVPVSDTLPEDHAETPVESSLEEDFSENSDDDTEIRQAGEDKINENPGHVAVTGSVARVILLFEDNSFLSYEPGK